jgi:hypothetical protein
MSSPASSNNGVRTEGSIHRHCFPGLHDVSSRESVHPLAEQARRHAGRGAVGALMMDSSPTGGSHSFI